MPRPGPRPYECVRRAWHSDRHQPIRGSLIQEIFRLANEVHKPATRENKEWLEKLPLVVFKTEEIMYSKANSEAEYLDLKTLWERTNDAIDTIIRKDNTPETEGDLLQPCIEAALNLGCVPRRASRSQRHNNLERYLSSSKKEGHHLQSSVHLLQQNSLSCLESWYSAFVTASKLNHFGNDVHSVIPDGSFEPKDSALHAVDSSPYYKCPSLGVVYPLYNSNVHPQYPAGNTIHSLPSVCEKEMSFLHNFIGNNNAKGTLNMSSIFGQASKDPCESECDLSLRLGLSLPPSSDEEMVSSHEAEDVGSSSSCSGSKCTNPSHGEARALNSESSIPLGVNDEPLESSLSKWRSEEEGNAMLLGF